MKKSLVVLVIILISACSAHAGSLTAGLRSAYSSGGDAAAIPVIIALSDHPSASEIPAAQPGVGYSLSQAHETVMRTLQDRASSSQSAVLRSLEILQSTGMARNVKSLWISNLISAELTRPAAELIANMSEVAEVGIDEVVTQRRMSNDAVNGTDPLTAMGILDAWVSGYKGVGRIVCVIGDGHGLSNSALSSSWRGRSAPASESWFDLGGSAAPTACGNESVEMLGLMCGGVVGSNSAIGVAPDATWIAANVFCAGTTRLSHILSALQWAADPDGNAGTMTDVPDAVACAWGLAAACSGGEPEIVWEAFANAEAMGPVIVFAASQDGKSGASSVRAPESRAEMLAVGNVDVRNSTADPNSGRGPSPCDATVTKPDLCGAGVAVRTTSDTDYITVSGTAAAASYVAGTVALIREANQTLSAEEIKTILKSTAVDFGSPGTDHVFGAGLVHAGRAVTLAMSSGRTGTVVVVVRSDDLPVSNAMVTLTSEGVELTTKSDNGEARFDHVNSDRSYTVRVTLFGYLAYTSSDVVTVDAGKAATVPVELERGFEDDAEFDQGWTQGVSGDNASSGTWIRAIPIGSKKDGRFVQPDNSPSGQFCFVTGNASSAAAEASEADVDNGRTTLRSPQFSLLDLTDPVVHFSYWYSNDRGAGAGSDFFRAQLSADGGRTWQDLINTSASTNGWASVNIPVNSIVVPTDRMMLQFVAEDLGTGSLVEAAVDDIRISGTPAVVVEEAPEAPGELTLDVQFNQVVLKWKPARDARAYRVYMWGSAENVIAPEHLYTTVSDTTVTVPLSDIPYREFYFQITATK